MIFVIGHGLLNYLVQTGALFGKPIDDPDFNPRYRDRNGYTALFLATKYQLTNVANYLVSRHKAQHAYTSDHRHELIEGIIAHNDIGAFIPIVESWQLNFSDSYSERCIDSNGFKMGLTLVPFMAKLNCCEMLKLTLDKYPDAVNKRI